MYLETKKTECYTCFEPVKKVIVCNKCEFESCIECYQNYIKTNVIHPQCMKCKYVCTYTETLSLFPTKFLAELNKIREEILYSLNRSTLPYISETYLEEYKLKSIYFISETLPSLYINANVILSDNSEIPISNYRVVGDEAVRITKMINTTFIKEKHDIYEFAIFDLRKVSFINMNPRIYDAIGRLRGKYILIPTGKIQDFNLLYNNIKNRYNRELLSEKSSSPNVNIQIRPCKKCPGYRNTLNTCQSCNSVFCYRCEEEIKEEEHICDKDILKNLELINKDSVKCPSCEAYIYKIHGCNQMWCTNCNTAFDWKTQKILDIKNFHNPHYIEFIKSGKKVIPRCEEDSLAHVNNKEVRHIREHLSELYASINNGFINIREETLLTSLRYINNEISVDKYKNKLQRLDKLENKQQNIQELNEILIIQTTEIFNTYKDDYPKLIVEVNRAIRDNNAYREELSNKFNNKIGSIEHIKPEKYQHLTRSLYYSNLKCNRCRKTFKTFTKFKDHLKFIIINSVYDSEFKIMSCAAIKDINPYYLYLV